MSDDLPLRQAVRGLMIDRQDRVLLVKLDLPWTDWVGWVLPGGGIEAGEDPVAALRRELHEETGLSNAFIGPVVCHRRIIGSTVAQGFSGQQEIVHLVPCHDFPLEPALAQHELRGEGILDLRWFTLDDLRTTTDTVVPAELCDLVERVLEFGGTVEPLTLDEA